MVLESLRTLFKRDLNKLKFEVSSYQQESILWTVDGAIANSGGNLCLHLIGNLNAFIGAELGAFQYTRLRDLEFSLKNVPRTELLLKIEETIREVDLALSNLNEGDLEKEYPLVVFKEKMATGYFLLHLATHLTYHLGQLNYHRRLLDT